MAEGAWLGKGSGHCKGAYNNESRFAAAVLVRQTPLKIESHQDIHLVDYIRY
jgi:hypothetical protein